MKATDTDIEPSPKEYDKSNNHSTDRDVSNNKDNEPLSTRYSLPRILIIINYLTSFLLVIFFILALFNLIFFGLLVIDLVLFIVTQIKISAILKKKSQLLSNEVIKYLKNKCRNKEALKKNIKEKFQVDTYVMHSLQNLLTSNKQITVRNNNNGEAVWKLNSSYLND